MKKVFAVSPNNLFDPKLNPDMKLSSSYIHENLPAIDEVMCSLCKVKFQKQDPDLKIRMQRHEQRHQRGKKYASRSSGGGNNIIGKVEWIEG